MLYFQSEKARQAAVAWTVGAMPANKGKTRVLVIDDDPSELQKAVAAAEAQGWWTLGVSPLNTFTEHAGCDLEYFISRADGIVTDLCWDDDPAGLIVVIEALSLGKPVVVCTNGRTADGGHANIGFVQGYVYAKGKTPFGWVETKDWTDAVLKLEGLLKK